MDRLYTIERMHQGQWHWIETLDPGLSAGQRQDRLMVARATYPAKPIRMREWEPVQRARQWQD